MGGDPSREGSESVCCESVGGPELSVGNNRRRRSVAKPAAEHIGYRVKCDRHALREREETNHAERVALNSSSSLAPTATSFSSHPLLEGEASPVCSCRIQSKWPRRASGGRVRIGGGINGGCVNFWP